MVLSPTVRPAMPADIPTVFELIRGLAEYEKLSDEVVGSEEALYHHLFGDRPYIESLLVEANGTPAGFALFLQNYSTAIGSPGYYLEDLFVFPEFRGQGFGKALFSALAKRACDQDFRHLQWSVLDWNAPAIAFYRNIGATVDDHHRIARITGNALTTLAQSPAPSTPVNGAVSHADMLDAHRIRAHLHPTSSSHSTSLIPLSTFTEAIAHALAVHSPPIEALGVWIDNALAGIATITHSYSTFLTQPGLLVESMAIAPDLYHPVQTTILHCLAALAVERNGGRLEWIVNQYDERAVALCQHLGGSVLPDWRICRIEGEAIATLASSSVLG